MTKNTIKTLMSTLSKKNEIYDLELIISFVLKKDRVFVISHPSYTISQNQVNKISKLYQLRLEGYPLAYIVGQKEFYGRTFKVNKDTLIPRPETELLIEQVLSFIYNNNISQILIVDIGTGSGIIPITLSKELPHQITKTLLASDISPKAIKIAEENASKFYSSNISFFQSNLLKNQKLVTNMSATKYKNIIITANLPYVNTAIKNDLLKQKESVALKYEPQIALWSDEEGLYHYKRLIQQTVQLDKVSKKNIISFYEISPEQHSALITYIKKIIPHAHIISFKDLSNKHRIIRFSLHKP